MFTKWQRKYRELSGFQKKVYGGISVLIILVLIFLLVYIFLPSQIYIEGQKTVYAPKDIIYVKVNENHVIREILPFFNNIDPIKDSVILTDYGKKLRLVFRKKGYPGEFLYQSIEMIPYKKIKQKLTCSHVTFLSDWKFNYINDTTTRVNYYIHGKTDFFHKLQLYCLSKKIPANLDSAKKNIENQIKNTLRQIHFSDIGFLPQDSILYLYHEHNTTKGDWMKKWDENFSNVLLYALKNKAINLSKPLFNLFYFQSGDSLKLRSCTPLRVPIKTEQSPYHCDSLYIKNYYAFQFNGAYEYLPYMLLKADSVLQSKHLEKDYSKPIIEQFIKGHTYSDDEMKWETRLLIPVKSEKNE